MGRPEIEELFHQYSEDVYNYLAYYLSSRDVDDLVQETFIRAMRGLESYKSQSHPKTWLLAIARNVAIDFARRRKKIRFISGNILGFLPSAQQPVDEVVQFREFQQKISSLLENMKPAYREIILLRVVLDLSTTEAAEMLGWSPAKVKTTLHRALSILRNDLQAWEREGFEWVGPLMTSR